MDDTDLLDYIKAYLEGSLTEAEQKALLLQLRDNPSAKEQFRQMRINRQAEETRIATSVRRKVNDLLSQGPPPMQKQRGLAVRWLWIAALALVILSITYFYVRQSATSAPTIPPAIILMPKDTTIGNNTSQKPKSLLTNPTEDTKSLPDLQVPPTQTPSPQKPANPPDVIKPIAQNNMPPQSPQEMAVRPRYEKINFEPKHNTRSISDPLWNDAVKLFKNQYYEGVLGLTVDISSLRPPDQMEWLALQAHSHYRLRQYLPAAQLFAQLSGLSPSRAAQSRWLALLSLAANGKAEAKVQFDHLSKQVTNNDPYANDLGALKQEIGW